MKKNVLMKLLALMLVLLFIVPLAAACNNGSGGGGSGDSSYDTQIQTGTEHDPKIPKMDYNGYEFTFLTATKASDPYDVKYVFSEGETSDLILDAVYRRNVVVEDKYNIKIRQTESSSVMSDVRAQVMSGNTDFDVVMIRGAFLATLAREKQLLDLNQLDWVDMNKPYWDQNAKEELKIGNSLYYTNCDLNLIMGFGVFFNKQLIEDYQLTSPYEYIENNEWTLDNFGKLVKSVSQDLNNDGLYTEEDRYGSTFEHNNVCWLLYASGIRATTNDSTGYPVFTLMNDKTVTAYEKIKDIFSDSSYSYCVTCSSMDAHGFAHKWDYARYLFTQNHYLMHIYTATGIEQFADMENEFGYVPLPKYDSTQSRYYSPTTYWAVMVACPTTTKDTDMTGRILEDLNYYSSVILIPDWFDVMLTRKYTRDDESEEAIRIIRETAVYDLGLHFDFGGMRTKILDVDPANNNISTNIAKLKKAIEADITDTYSKFTS